MVEARPGGNANIAADFVARANPDGHTLLATTTFVVSNPIVDSSTRWAARDLVPVSAFSQSHAYLMVPANSPAKTVREFADMAKKAKPILQFADGGPGTSTTMAFELLKKSAGIQLEPIAYKGAPPAMTDLANGLLTVAIFPGQVAGPQIGSGKLRALAILGNVRSAQFRNLPTIAEAGYPDVTTLTWLGLHAPRGTPADVLARLDGAVQVATRSDAVKTRIANTGGDVNYMSTAQFATILVGETQRWEAFARAAAK